MTMTSGLGKEQFEEIERRMQFQKGVGRLSRSFKKINKVSVIAMRTIMGAPATTNDRSNSHLWLDWVIYRGGHAVAHEEERRERKETQDQQAQTHEWAQKEVELIYERHGRGLDRQK